MRQLIVRLAGIVVAFAMVISLALNPHFWGVESWLCVLAFAFFFAAEPVLTLLFLLMIGAVAGLAGSGLYLGLRLGGLLGGIVGGGLGMFIFFKLMTNAATDTATQAIRGWAGGD